jgi:hypothetical protein
VLLKPGSRAAESDHFRPSRHTDYDGRCASGSGKTSIVQTARPFNAQHTRVRYGPRRSQPTPYARRASVHRVDRPGRREGGDEVQGRRTTPAKMAASGHGCDHDRKPPDSTHRRCQTPTGARDGRWSGEQKMASVYRQIEIDASPELVWDVIRDVGAVHTRLAPGSQVTARASGISQAVRTVVRATEFRRKKRSAFASARCKSPNELSSSKAGGTHDATRS